MIKDKKAIDGYGYFAPDEDWIEAMNTHYEQGYIAVNWDFVDTISEKLPTFDYIREPFEGAMLEQTKKGKRDDQK